MTVPQPQAAELQTGRGGGGFPHDCSAGETADVLPEHVAEALAYRTPPVKGVKTLRLEPRV